jgi:hypothetical protein
MSVVIKHYSRTQEISDTIDALLLDPYTTHREATDEFQIGFDMDNRDAYSGAHTRLMMGLDAEKPPVRSVPFPHPARNPR